MKLSKAQHLVAFLILLPSVPLAILLSLLVTVSRGALIGSEWLYDTVGWPFLSARRKWLERCERVNSALSKDTPHAE